MTTKPENELLRCSFCNKSQREVEKLIAGPKVFICNECVDICLDIIAEDKALEEKQEKQENAQYSPPTPHRLAMQLSKSIIGHDEAKRAISVAVYNHYKRIASPERGHLEKSNLLLIGPTGSGKTLFARTLAKILSVPFYIGDATALTEAGYVGEDVENLLLGLLQNADSDLKRAERGIIFVDEIDKLRRSRGNVSITRDVSGEGVQQALLKIIEGTVANIPPKGGRKHPNDEHIRMNTRGILFIAGGSFEGLEEIVRKRISRIRSGHVELEESRDEVNASHRPLSMTDEMVLKEVAADDLIEFGLIPEFVGRLHTIVTLGAPDRETMVRILVEPEDSIVNQYKQRFADEGVSLQVSEDALWQVAELALTKRSGARGLRSIVENCLRDVMYDLPSQLGIARCVVTADTLKTGRPLLFEGDGQPVLERKNLFVASGPRGRPWVDRIEAMLAGLDGVEIFASGDQVNAAGALNALGRALASTKVALLLIDGDYLKAGESAYPELTYLLDRARTGAVIVRWMLLDDCRAGLLEDLAKSAACWLDLPLSSLAPREQNEMLYQLCEETTRLLLELHQPDALDQTAVGDAFAALSSGDLAASPAADEAPEKASKAATPEGKMVNLDWR